MKWKTISRLALFLLAVPMLLMLQGCPDDPGDEEAEKIKNDPDYPAKSFLRSQYMDIYYYWRDEVKDRNAALKPYDYNIYDFFDEMLYSEDRWSWMCEYHQDYCPLASLNITVFYRIN